MKEKRGFYEMYPLPEIRARTRVQFTNPILADCLRRHAVLFQYAGIEPDFDAQGCFFTVRDDLFPMPRQLSDFAPCLMRFLAGYNDRDDAAALRDLLRAQGAALTRGYTALSIDQQAVLTGTYAARWNTRPTSYAKDYYAAVLRHIADRDGLPFEAVTLDRFACAVQAVPARVSAVFTFDGTQSVYLRTYRLRGFKTDANPLVKRIFVTYDGQNQPRQATTYDARVRPTAHRSIGTDFARQISPKPKELDFAGRHFVLTGGDKPAMIRVIQSRGGIVHPSAVRTTDYLIIGDEIRRETAKITRVKQLIAHRDRPVTALWEHEFWQLCAQSGAVTADGSIVAENGDTP